MVDCDIFQDFNRIVVVQKSRLVLEAKNLQYSVEIPFTTKTPSKIKKAESHNNIKKIPIKAVYGIIELEAEKYVVAVTKASVIGQIYHRKIYQVDRVEFIPVAESTSSKDKSYIKGLVELFDRKQFYYSDDYDLTNSIETFVQNQCSMNKKNSNFFYNESWIEDFIKVQAYQWITGFISGLIVIHFCTLNTGYTCEIVVLSRRDKRRQGLRWISRGANLDGNTSNTAETEQIFYAQKAGVQTVFSFVQTRGSMPFKWQQKPDLKWSPKCSITANDKINLELCQKHFEDQKKSYENICILNLVDKKGSQKMLGNKFKDLVNNMNDNNVRYVWFDFHDQCKKMQYQNLSKLLAQVDKELSDYGYFHIEIKGKIISRKNSQKGVFRTNCMDCLDRTNVVQSVVARHILHEQLAKLGLPKPKNQGAFQKLPDQLQEYFRQSWCKNADTLSVLYSGTPAMKTDFTLLGKRTTKGEIMDLYFGIKRFVLGNFYDSRGQDFIDLSVGRLKPKKTKISHSFCNFIFFFIVLLLLTPFLISHVIDHHVVPHSTNLLQTQVISNNSNSFKAVAIILGIVILYKLFQLNSRSLLRRPVLNE